MDDSKREMARQIANSHFARGDALGWFDDLYAQAAGDTSVIPWADSKPNPYLVSWLSGTNASGSGRTALVVGCGLGDDAEAIASRGFQTTAFDISPTAVAWCQRRFPETKVVYRCADLFAANSWKSGFDFVFECYTLQSMPPDLRETAKARVAELVRPGGTLLLVARGRYPTESEGGLPWPLTRDELNSFGLLGLHETSFEEIPDTEEPNVRRFRVTYARPQEHAVNDNRASRKL